MARTTIQIEDGLIGSIAAINPSIDVKKGPIRAVFVQPQADAIRSSELVTDDLALRYSLQYTRTRNPDVIELYCFNHGQERGSGSPSLGTVIFFTHTKPVAGTLINIPQGTVVTTVDQSLSFQTNTDVIVTAEAFDIFFNNTNRRYEIPATVESIGIGPEFEIAANRLTQMTSTVDGINGVYQPVATGPSTTVESNDSMADRQQAKFIGSAIGTAGGIESTIRDFNPDEILDVAVIFSTETDLFQRPTRRPAYDIYIVGSRTAIQTDTFYANGGETGFTLTKKPVSDIGNVQLDGGTITTATLLQDNTPSTGHTTRATDKVLLGQTLVAGQTVTVSYNYDALLNEIQDFIDQSNQKLWRADILLRQAIGVSIAVSVDVTILSSLDTNRIMSLLEEAVYSVINLNQMGITYFPDNIRQNIESTVAGLSKVRVTQFMRQDSNGVIPVDVVETLRNEYAFVGSTNLNINVKT